MDTFVLIKERRRRQGAVNRANGEAFERLVMNHEKRNSIFALRSAGSYGPIDVVSQKTNGEIWYISVKRNGYFHFKELDILRKIKEQVSKNNGQARFKLAYYTSPRKWRYENLK